MDCLAGARRHSAFGILGYAEAEARAFVVAEARESGTPIEPATETSLAHGQAERLAASFRALALVLSALLSLARRFARLGEAGPQIGLPMLPRTPAETNGLRCATAVAAPDTS